MRSTTLSIVFLPSVLLVFAAMIHERPRNPPVNPESSIETALDVPPRVRAFLRRSCYDCHSAETRWPWYAAIPPVSGLIESDVKHGREAMNFSEWPMSAGASSLRAAGTLTAACASVRGGTMPKRPYLYLHPDARPSPADTQTFCAWANEQSSLLRASARARSYRGISGIHN